jgi:hypothetical protein
MAEDEATSRKRGAARQLTDRDNVDDDVEENDTVSDECLVLVRN